MHTWWKWLNSIKTGSKWAQNTCLSIPNGLGSLLEKRVFDPFLTHFWSQNSPISRHFGIMHGAKCATTGSKRAKNACLSIPSGLGTTEEKIIFFAPGTPVDPPLAPTVRGRGCPPPPPSDHWYGGLGASGRFCGLETTKSGGLRVDYVPSEFGFAPRSPRYGPCLVSGCWCTLRRFWGFLAPFGAVSRTYRGVEGH